MKQTAQLGSIICPVCKIETDRRVCPSCEEDLSFLRECQTLAIESYNLGLRLARQSKGSNIKYAEECLCLATNLKADFIEPYIILGKLYAQQKRYAKAIACLGRALSIDSRNKAAQDCLNILRELLGGDEELQLEAYWQGKPVRIGSRVQCTDGYAGMVWRIIPGDKSHNLTHIVVSVDDFFPKNLLVPAELITDVNGDIAVIGIRRRELLLRMSQYRSDKELTASVDDALLSYEPIRVIRGMVLEVTATDGTITLSGNVSSYTIKKKAGELAASVKGVLAIENLLVCDFDLELTAAQALAGDPQIRGERILVRSYLGVVRLEGTVHSIQAGDIAQQLVLNINGVKQVINKLTVEGSPYRE